MSSASSSANSSPVVVQPLHHPGQEATVQAPVGTTNPTSSLNSQDILAKRLAAHSMVSPTDNMVSPCTAKLHSAKRKHFSKGKPLSLSNAFAQHAAQQTTITAADGAENKQPE